MNGLQRLVVLTTVVASLALGACAEKQNREDFASQLKNKTEVEVEKMAGKPARVDSSDPKRVAWVYKERTFDVTTRKTDAEADVIFVASAEDGKPRVTEVVFK